MLQSKVSQSGRYRPKGVILVIWGAILVKGGDFKIFKLTLDILELQMKSKKKNKVVLLS